MKTLKDLKAQLLANPETRAEYDAQAPEFAAARELIAARARVEVIHRACIHSLKISTKPSQCVNLCK